MVLPIGQYRLAVEMANFARYVREPLTLNVNDVLRLTIDLKLGTTQEVIQITSDAPLVEVVSNSLGKVTSGPRNSGLAPERSELYPARIVAGRRCASYSGVGTGGRIPSRGACVFNQRYAAGVQQLS